MLIFAQVVEKKILAGGMFIAALISRVTAIRPILSHSLTPRMKLIL